MGGWFSMFDHGTPEVAVFEKGNKTEKEESIKGCLKPHNNQLTTSEFTINSLPEGYQEDDLYELVNYIADFTVRISVNFSSKKRLNFWQQAKVQFQGNNRGERHSGSGRIADVYQDTNEIKTCLCSNCINGTKNNAPKEIWTVVVFTATHVVFDDSEARRSECKLFYDTKDGMFKQLNVSKCRWRNVAGDLCFIECVTCDSKFANEIKAKFKRFNELWKGIRDRYALEQEHDSKRLVVIVSHPHGKPQKKISVGRLQKKYDRHLKNDLGYQLFYDSPTCKGSSGAPVYLYGQDWFQEEYVHSGTNKKQLNYSTTWCPKRDEAE
ncbi:uncharacterized protein LOC106050695 [Biomphalaria glabrata]|uniref:Uncharacterized protein LOC106050695 n=1 Tax=Biomphalaria glabrata TaxID=6526 RepID=A0A9W2YU48_BIOGL|nr:uncharacterized protein LOC106050695 [Biomphalaria glabrata]XP_055866318.1 uncharacterized protein LOC106050695 [Biomphalaria glabrata]